MDTCSGNCDAGRYEYLYQGQRFLEFGDSDTKAMAGLYVFPARIYDPDQMRWTSLDAEFDSISPYTAMSNNWVNFRDPDGNVVTFWIAVGLGAFAGVTFAIGAMFANSKKTNRALTTLRALNAAQLHYKGFLIIHIFREGLLAYHPIPQLDRVLHIMQVPTNMVLLLTFLLMTKKWVTGGQKSVTDTTPNYNSGSWAQITGIILSKTVWQAIIGALSYLGTGGQAVVTVYPALVLGELNYMYVAHRFKIKRVKNFWEGTGVPNQIVTVMNSTKALFLYGMTGAVASTFVLGGMWQGYGNPPPTLYWGHNKGLALKGPGIGWNALTMVVVEGIIYLFWISSQGALYLRQIVKHSSGTINMVLPQHRINTTIAPTPTNPTAQPSTTTLQMVSTRSTLNNNPNENDDDAANDSEDEDQKSQSDGRTQNINPGLQEEENDDSSEKP